MIVVAEHYRIHNLDVSKMFKELFPEEDDPRDPGLVVHSGHITWDSQGIRLFLKCKRTVVQLVYLNPTSPKRTYTREWCTVLVMSNFPHEVEQTKSNLDEWVKVMEEHDCPSLADAIVHYSNKLLKVFKG